MNLVTVSIKVPEGLNLIIGQAHFIKTVEDLYETLISSSPLIKFGVAFCESSGPALIRYDGNDNNLQDIAVSFAKDISAGHIFVIILRDSFPINILNRVKMVEEVASIFCATANPVEVIIAETQQGRGIMGVVDGVKSLGVESEKDRRERHEFLRRIGYKR
ncbi:MAG: adenosine-specific kinase [Thaumarchaeota archaeon]|nr:adenosine-specific kinase [Nitrososphaerota archaeon]MCL5317516.1 adenosine-specific kinase [Nitrososphaerota archaeon]